MTRGWNTSFHSLGDLGDIATDWLGDTSLYGSQTGNVMISGISAATSGLTAAQARLERAASSISSGLESAETIESAPAPSVLDMVGAQVEMISARFAFSASLVALRASTDMLAHAIEIGGYGIDPRQLR
jgi:hypothetical protein